MNKTELIAAVAEKADLSKKDAEAAITAAVEAITGALIEGEKVQLVAPLRSRPAPPVWAATPRLGRRSPFPRPVCPYSRPVRP